MLRDNSGLLLPYIYIPRDLSARYKSSEKIVACSFNFGKQRMIRNNYLH